MALPVKGEPAKGGTATQGAESEQVGAAWKIVLIAALAGKDGVAPTSDEAETSLNVMLNTVKDGKPLGHFVAFDRTGELVNFG